MDLKIKDVADLLNVSETTIRRWLAEGKIPAYRINHQYRFSRTEIQDWLTRQKLISKPSLATNASSDIPTTTIKAPSASRGSRQYSLYRALHKGGIYHDIPGETKEEVIRNALHRIAKNIEFDADVLTELFLEREKMHSTALNHGIAVPHTRDFLLNGHQDVVAVVFPKNPIAFGALDGQPVHTLFFIFACEDRRHLHLLAKIAHMSSQKKTLAFLENKPTKDHLLDFVKNWESSIQELLKEEGEAG